MIERTGEVTRDLNLCDEIFAFRLPGTNIKPITYDKLPDKIRGQIKGKGNCALALEIAHRDLNKTFVGENPSFEVVYFQDSDAENRYLGEGVIYIEKIDEELCIPVVGHTLTSKKFRRRGLGTRRLLVMDAVSRFVFNEPLHSTSKPRLSQKSIWEKLVEQEYAEIHNLQGVQRYKFIR